MTDYKQLCADLADELDAETGYVRRMDGKRITHPDVVRARAALAEPEPEGPMDDSSVNFDELFYQCAKRQDENFMPLMDVQSFSEAVGAVLARWGNHPGSPDGSGNLKAELTGSPADDEMAELATAEMVRQLRTKAATEKVNRCHYSANLLTRAADLLEHLSPAQPVPVSERLPGAGDCDAEGLCWWWRTDDSDEWWELLCITDAREYNARCGSARYTHWLPAHALPLPTDTSRSI